MKKKKKKKGPSLKRLYTQKQYCLSFSLTWRVKNERRRINDLNSFYIFRGLNNIFSRGKGKTVVLPHSCPTWHLTRYVNILVNLN